jgi:hypothetical protein
MLPVSTQSESLGNVVSHQEELGRVTMSRAERREQRSSVKAGVLGGLGVLAVVAVIVVTVSSGGSGKAGGDPGAAPGAAGQTSGGNSAAVDVATALRDWYVGGGQQHLTTVGRDATSVGDDTAANDVTSMGSDCTTLQTDVQAAQVYAPIPDPVTQQHWTKALDQFAQAAAHCVDGATYSDDSLIAKSGKELRAAGAELTLTTDKVNELSAP